MNCKNRPGTTHSLLLIADWTGMVFENHRQSLIQHCERSDILSGQKLIKNAKQNVHFGEFFKPEACGQTVLPDMSVLIGQKLTKKAKIQKFKCNILNNFQTTCTGQKN